MRASVGRSSPISINSNNTYAIPYDALEVLPPPRQPVVSDTLGDGYVHSLFHREEPITADVAAPAAPRKRRILGKKPPVAKTTAPQPLTGGAATTPAPSRAAAVESKPTVLSVLASLKSSTRKPDPFLRRLEAACMTTLALHGLAVNAREVLEALASSGVFVTTDKAMQAAIADRTLLDAAERAGRKWEAQRAACTTGSVFVPTPTPVARPQVPPRPPRNPARLQQVPPVEAPAAAPVPVFEPSPTPVAPSQVPPRPLRNPARLQRVEPLVVRRRSAANGLSGDVTHVGLGQRPSALFRHEDGSRSRSPLSTVDRLSKEIMDFFIAGHDLSSSSDESDTSSSDGVRTPDRRSDSASSLYSQPSAPPTPRF